MDQIRPSHFAVAILNDKRSATTHNDRRSSSSCRICDSYHGISQTEVPGIASYSRELNIATKISFIRNRNIIHSDYNLNGELVGDIIQVQFPNTIE